MIVAILVFSHVVWWCGVGYVLTGLLGFAKVCTTTVLFDDFKMDCSVNLISNMQDHLVCYERLLDFE